MLDADADHPFGRGEKAQGEERRVELVAALAQFARRDMRDQLLPLDQHLMHMHRVEQRQVLRDQPVAIDEFHGARALCSKSAVGRDVGEPTDVVLGNTPLRPIVNESDAAARTNPSPCVAVYLTVVLRTVAIHI